MISSGVWPPVTPAFQPLIQQQKTIAVQVQPFAPVYSSSPPEQNQGIQLKLSLYDSGKSIDPSAKICIATGQINLSRFEVLQHCFNALQSLTSVSSSAPL